MIGQTKYIIKLQMNLEMIQSRPVKGSHKVRLQKKIEKLGVDGVYASSSYTERE